MINRATSSASIETSRIGEPDAVTRFALGDKEVVAIDWLRWATPSRLLIGISLTSRVPKLSTRTKGTPLGSRVYAVDMDGSNAVMLFSNTSNAKRYAFHLSQVIDVPTNDPDHVIMPGWSGTSYDLYRVNIRDGVATRIANGNAQTFHWDAFARTNRTIDPRAPAPGRSRLTRYRCAATGVPVTLSAYKSGRFHSCGPVRHAFA